MEAGIFSSVGLSGVCLGHGSIPGLGAGRPDPSSGPPPGPGPARLKASLGDASVCSLSTYYVSGGAREAPVDTDGSAPPGLRVVRGTEAGQVVNAERQTQFGGPRKALPGGDI